MEKLTKLNDKLIGIANRTYSKQYAQNKERRN